MSSLLEVKNLSVSYGKEKILDNISFSLGKGETLAVLGPNGSGKTSLLKALIGILPHEGTIATDGVRVGYVPQKLDMERNLPLTGEEFLQLAESSKRSAAELFALVNLPVGHLQKSIAAFSSGEFQKLLIAFALASKPTLLLFDEPTASVDVGGQETIYALIHRLQEQEQFSIILVSHDLTTVYEYADKVLCINKTQTCFGVPKDVLTPEELQKLYGGGQKFYRHLHHA